MASALMQRFPEAAWIDPGATVYGAVAIGAGSSLWPGVVIRAELLSVTVGRFVNLQDHVMVHVGYGTPDDRRRLLRRSPIAWCCTAARSARTA